MKAFLLAFLVWAGMLWQSIVAPFPVYEVVVPEKSASPPAALPVAKDKPSPPAAPASKTPPVIEVPVLAEEFDPDAEYSADFASALESAIHNGINAERVKNGLDALKYETALADVARGHSADMAKENYFAHEDGDGCASDCRLDTAGYKWRWEGENIFLMKSNFRYSVSEAAAVIVQGWMGSEGHRKNILESHFKNEGIGVAVLGDKIYATELFSLPR